MILYTVLLGFGATITGFGAIITGYGDIITVVIAPNFSAIITGYGAIITELWCYYHLLWGYDHRSLGLS